jgi:hypothetical protein
MREESSAALAPASPTSPTSPTSPVWVMDTREMKRFYLGIAAVCGKNVSLPINWKDWGCVHKMDGVVEGSLSRRHERDVIIFQCADIRPIIAMFTRLQSHLLMPLPECFSSVTDMIISSRNPVPTKFGTKVDSGLWAAHGQIASWKVSIPALVSDLDLDLDLDQTFVTLPLFGHVSAATTTTAQQGKTASGGATFHLIFDHTFDVLFDDASVPIVEDEDKTAFDVKDSEYRLVQGLGFVFPAPQNFSVTTTPPPSPELPPRFTDTDPTPSSPSTRRRAHSCCSPQQRDLEKGFRAVHSRFASEGGSGKGALSNLLESARNGAVEDFKLRFGPSGGRVATAASFYAQPQCLGLQVGDTVLVMTAYSSTWYGTNLRTGAVGYFDSAKVRVSWPIEV